MNKKIKSILKLIFACGFILLFISPAEAVKFEIGLGLANDIAFDEPLPGLTDGFGYLFSGTLMFKYPVTVSIGVIGTRHEFDGGENQSQLIRAGSRRNAIFLQVNYQILRLIKTEFSAGIGVTSVNINGGDADSGSYVNSSYEYDMDNFGYSGTGQWLGIDIHHHIQSGYFVIFGLKYNLLTYSRHQYQAYSSSAVQLIDFENSANREGNSLTAYLGISFRIDFSRF